MSNNELVQNFVIYNGKPQPVSEFDYSLTKRLPGVYEVIRIIDGVPLFLEKHMTRFRHSASLLGYNIQESDESLDNQIKNLIEMNGCNAGNIKIVINNLNNEVQDNFMFFIESHYPTREQVENGVPVILYEAERENPNAKSTNLSFRQAVEAEIASSNVYEALLVNKKYEITEGSRSNFFVVKGDILYTTPVKNVLPGVTRHVVLDLCSSLSLRVVEEPVTVELLKDIDGLFITGTSPQVLPISSVDKKSYPSASNSIISKVRIAYEDAVSEYIKTHK